ncbi:hypothetical protein [Rhodopirellula sallentina]|uniref:Signal peptide protein n=1 Tax=Rhodopirellula sallentina SM41 TaxID=1263870 RepID=M5TRX6_9BACT|nr:hypothetical protein [Rhodopirellula sallentina]EMI51799.1 signal peptide protein [Rhodopirellula sallentina SM41]
MSRKFAIAMVLFVMCLVAPMSVTAKQSAPRGHDITLVIGAPGTSEFAEQFAQWADRWRGIAERGEIEIEVIGETESSESDYETLRSRVSSWSDSGTTHWIVFVGHGTHREGESKFNLRGPDVTASELAKWLNTTSANASDPQLKAPLVIVNCSSSSGPFVNALSAPGRIVVTATESATEQNFARFGDYFSEAMLSLESDLDHDHEVSVLEAFLRASKQTQRFYESESRIATEHALIDDNGDALGTRAKAFRGTRVIANAKGEADIDGQLARRVAFPMGINGQTPQLSDEQSVERDHIEMQVETLRRRKHEMPETTYYDELELLMLELAKIYQAASQEQQGSDGANVVTPAKASDQE